MPRGDNPNSRANLIKNSERTPKERKDQATKAGLRSGEVRAAQAGLNADLKERCTPERIAKLNEKVLAMAERGNLRAYEIVRGGLGENPTDKVAVAIGDKTLERMKGDFDDV